MIQLIDCKIDTASKGKKNTVYSADIFNTI